MQLELAERGGRRNRVYVQGYNRHANYVPGYSRHKPLRDSSLFSFKLADLSGKVITNADVFLTVPDPDNVKAPRQVRVDMFQNLPEHEFVKLMNYVQDYNSPAIIDAATQAYLNPALSDPQVQADVQAAGNETALSTVESVFQADPNGTTVKESFWDKKSLFGIKNKYSLPLVGFGLYKLLF